MNNDLFLGENFAPDSTDDINFLETRIHDLSPFAALEVEIDNVVYKTAEHAYQALRSLSEARPAIINATSPLAAWREGQKGKVSGMLIGVDKEELMEKIFCAKLEQHPYLNEVLKQTGQRTLVKIMPTDLYWGTNSDGVGENNMGKLWMKLRNELE